MGGGGGEETRVYQHIHGSSGRPFRHTSVRAQEMSQSRGGRPGFAFLISLMDSVDVKQHPANNTPVLSAS